jgi:hypothetical protein
MIVGICEQACLLVQLYSQNVHTCITFLLHLLFQDLVFLYTTKNTYGVQEDFIPYCAYEINDCDISHTFCASLTYTYKLASFSSNILGLQQNATNIISY